MFRFDISRMTQSKAPIVLPFLQWKGEVHVDYDMTVQAGQVVAV